MVFELTPSASDGRWLFCTASTPTRSTDSSSPPASSPTAAGNLYGTTQFGGTGACTNGFAAARGLALPSAGGTWTETINSYFQGTDGWKSMLA